MNSSSNAIAIWTSRGVVLLVAIVAFQPAFGSEPPDQAGGVIARCEGHTAKVTGLTFSPDGRALVSAGEDRTVRIWDLESGDELSSETAHAQPVLAVTFGPGGWSFVSGGADGTLLWCELATGTSRLVPHVKGQPLEKLAFSTDGGKLRVVKRPMATTKTVDGVMFFFDAATVLTLEAGATGEPRADVLEEVSSATLSPDGRLLLLGTQALNGRMRMALWDAEARREVVQFHAPHNGGRSPLPTCALSPDGQRAAYSDPNAGHAPIVIVRVAGSNVARK